MNTNKLKLSFKQSYKSLLVMLPLLLLVLMLISLFITFVPDDFYSSFLNYNPTINSFLSALFGSISTGNPVMSYVIGGEMLHKGVALITVSSFMLTWVTVGFIQFPAESMILGKRFAILRNLFSFVFSLIIAFLVVFTISLF